MNLVFVGTSRFGLRCLETAYDFTDINVTGIVTARKSIEISYRPQGITNVLHADVGAFGASYAIPVWTVERSMNARGLLEAVTQWRPDAFLVAGWYHMLPQRWLELAPAYGMHASLLPDYSGGAPLVWAMINGESKTGITLFQMDGGVDTGPIALQQEEPILPRDTIATLYARVEERGVEMLREALPKLASDGLPLRPQNMTKRRFMPQRGPEDGWIDWSRDAVSLDRFIRAQTRPYPGAFTTMNGKQLYIWQAHVDSARGANRVEGLVSWMQDGTYAVTCGEGALVLEEVTYEHKPYMRENLSECFKDGGQRLGT